MSILEQFELRSTEYTQYYCHFRSPVAFLDSWVLVPVDHLRRGGPIPDPGTPSNTWNRDPGHGRPARSMYSVLRTYLYIPTTEGGRQVRLSSRITLRSMSVSCIREPLFSRCVTRWQPGTLHLFAHTPCTHHALSTDWTHRWSVGCLQPSIVSHTAWCCVSNWVPFLLWLIARDPSRVAHPSPSPGPLGCRVATGKQSLHQRMRRARLWCSGAADDPGHTQKGI